MSKNSLTFWCESVIRAFTFYFKVKTLQIFHLKFSLTLTVSFLLLVCQIEKCCFVGCLYDSKLVAKSDDIKKEKSDVMKFCRKKEKWQNQNKNLEEGLWRLRDEIITNIIEILKIAENGISTSLTHSQNELKISFRYL